MERELKKSPPHFVRKDKLKGAGSCRAHCCQGNRGTHRTAQEGEGVLGDEKQIPESG